MSSNMWKENKLGDIAEIKTGPFGSHLKNEQYIYGGTPVITVEHITNFAIANINYPSVNKYDAERLATYTLQEGDIVFSRVGSVDLSAYVNNINNGWIFSSRMLRVRVKKEIDAKYLSYFFRQRSFREYILNISVGATMPSINTKILQGISVTYPPLPEQQAIAGVLSVLDDKIDLLQRQNQTLEQMAATLFRQWFIEEAQEDWEEVSLEYFGKIVCGKTPSKQNLEYFGDEVPFLKIPDMHGKTFIYTTSDGLSFRGAESQIKKMIPKNSICVSCIATVGLVSISGVNLQTNQQINSIVPKDEKYIYFLYLYMKNMYAELQNLASGGTATLNLNTTDFSKILIKNPIDRILSNFNDVAKSMFEKIAANYQQMQTLQTLRDTLLPKLISGEVRLKGFTEKVEGLQDAS